MTINTYLVEREPDEFDTIKAEILTVDSGTLVFRNDNGKKLVLLLAPGHWISVVMDEDES